MGFLGEKLTNNRKEKNISLAAAAAATKIKVEYLRALEEERFDELPSVTYVRGFLKIYARFLGLQPEPLLRAWAEIYQPAQPKVVLVERKRTSPIPFLPSLKWKFILPAAGSVLILLLVLIGVFNLIRGGVSPATSPRGFSEAAYPYSGSSGLKIPLPPEAAGPPVAAPELNLEIRAEEDVWLEIRADGSLVFLSTLPAGSVKRWPRAGRFQVRVSHPEKIRLFFKGEEMNLPRPADSSPLLLSLTEEGMKIND